MCASSCASTASSCRGVSPKSALAGTSIIGLRCPTTVGTSTSAERHRRTARDTRSRRDARERSSSKASATGRALRRRRSTRSQPPTMRDASKATPASQKTASQGTRRRPAHSRRVDAGETGARPSARGAGGPKGLSPRSAPARSRAESAQAPSEEGSSRANRPRAETPPRHAVATGSKSISARATHAQA